MARRRPRERNASWTLGPIAAEERGCLLSAAVGGGVLSFRSETIRLRPAVESFAGPLLLPAMKARARLLVPQPLDATWVLGTRTLAGVFAEWWGYPATYPIQAATIRRDESHPAPGHALCFTGGVDSFYTLLSAASRYDHLLYVFGLDVGLGDHVRREALSASLEEIARETGKQLVLLSTDVRSHAAFSTVSWERNHGAVLAAAGHLLGHRVGRLSIPPSFHVRREIPWGTHPRTDELWSTHRVRIHHGDAAIGRRERLRRIAHYPLVRRHLRVCWENRTPTGNCSRCDKCLRTMATLAVFGLLDRFEVFDTSTRLPERIDALGRVGVHAARAWHELLDLGPDPALARSIQRLVARSRPRWWHRFLR